MKNQLKEFRKSRHITQQEIADLCGVAQNTVSNWESGRQDISIEYVNTIANHYKVKPQQIVIYDDIENTLNAMNNLAQIGLLGGDITEDELADFNEQATKNPQLIEQLNEMQDRNRVIIENALPLLLTDREIFNNIQDIVKSLTNQEINTIKKIKSIIDIIIKK